MTDTRKTQQINTRTLWVWPHGPSFRPALVHPATVDEMQMEYEPGLPVSIVRKHLAKTLADIRTRPEEDWSAVHDACLEIAGQVTGFWVVPHCIWEAVGAICSTAIEDEGQDVAIQEAVVRYVASQAVLHVGSPVED